MGVVGIWAYLAPTKSSDANQVANSTTPYK